MKKFIILSIALLIGGAVFAQVNTREIPNTKLAVYVKSNVDGLPAIQWPLIHFIVPGPDVDQKGVINTKCIIEKMKPDALERGTNEVRYIPEKMKPY